MARTMNIDTLLIATKNKANEPDSVPKIPVGTNELKTIKATRAEIPKTTSMTALKIGSSMLDIAINLFFFLIASAVVLNLCLFGIPPCFLFFPVALIVRLGMKLDIWISVSFLLALGLGLGLGRRS